MEAVQDESAVAQAVEAWYYAAEENEIGEARLNAIASQPCGTGRLRAAIEGSNEVAGETETNFQNRRSKMNITATKWILTASENVDPDPNTYTFDVYVFPSGEALVQDVTVADAWYSSLDEVVPNGMDILTDSEETKEGAGFSLEDIKESVRFSASSYGKEAIPESLRFFLKKKDR